VVLYPGRQETWIPSVGWLPTGVKIFMIDFGKKEGDA